ncbi:hypothetical protein [Bradyrhizobium diazoefficiens]
MLSITWKPYPSIVFKGYEGLIAFMMAAFMVYAIAMSTIVHR